MPEIAELSKHVMIEETKQGLNIELDRPERQLDVSGRLQGAVTSARAGWCSGWRRRSRRCRTGSRSPATPRRAKQPGKPGYGPWELSADRANSVRKILEEEGVPTASFFMVAGRADTQPLFPDDPFVAANRRVTITLMREAPPLPANLKP